MARECERQGIKNVDLILAIISVESSFIPKRVRYEPGYPYLWKVKEFAKIFKITEASETVLQMCSWGLGQLMGSSARWCGYAGWIPDLCDPLVGTIWMLTFFKKRCMPYEKMEDQIAVYNAGSIRKEPGGTYSNQAYVNKVLKALEEVRYQRSILKPLA